ncbi:MAG: hypothetical protein AAF392_02740 [Bacteroidota bacterium]
MSKSNILRQLANLIGYITLQAAFAQAIVPAHDALCFIYVGGILLLPWQRTGLVLQLLLAFVIGLIIDAFYNSLGIHAFASVLMVYSKAFLLKLMLPASSYKLDARPTLNSMGFKKFSVFVLILLAIHHAAVFFLDAWDSALYLISIRRVVLSTLLTYFVICTVQSLPTLIISNR